MGDYDWNRFQRGPRFRLGEPGEFQLRLDPSIEAELRRLELEIGTGRFRQLCLSPDWSRFYQSDLDRLLTAPPPSPRPPLVPRGAGPSTPRRAELGDLMAAVWAIPTVQQAANRVSEEASRQLQRGWRGLSLGERTLLISHGALIAGGAVAGVLSNRETRQAAFGLVENRDVSVPGVDGLSFRISRYGAGLNSPLPFVPGLSVRGHFSVNDPSTPHRVDYQGMVNFDVAEFLRSRHIAW